MTLHHISLPGRRAAALLIAALAGLGAVARAQTIYVADPNGAGVSSYTINGSPISSSAVAGSNFEGLALSPSGTTLYVTNAVGQPNMGQVLGKTINNDGTIGGGFAFFAGGGGLDAPFGLATTSSNVYIADFNNGDVFKYDLSGTQISNIYVGTTDPYGLAISGNILWVSQATTGAGANTINGYSLSGSFSGSPTPVATITTGLSHPNGLAVSGNTLYVANAGDGTILTFDATTGASQATLVSGLNSPHGIAIYGSDLFVTGGDGTVKAFDAMTGIPLAGFTTITGLSAPNGIVVSSVPEPATYAAIAGVLALGLAVYRRRHYTVA